MRLGAGQTECIAARVGIAVYGHGFAFVVDVICIRRMRSTFWSEKGAVCRGELNRWGPNKPRTPKTLF